MRRMVNEKDIALMEDLNDNNISSKTISQLYIVDNIKEISSDILNKLKAGDIVLKNTNGQLHAYSVSFKKDDEGICLTYSDASVVETQSYDLVDGVWTYNSEDKTNLVNYTAGDNISINNGVISATDTTYAAGDNITIEDGVISSSGGDVWESVVGITFMSRICYFRLFTKEQITSTNLQTILASELADKYIDAFVEGGNLPEISGNKVLPIAVEIVSGNFSLTYFIPASVSLSSATIAYSSSNAFVQYSHKLN